ncbi:ABC transporter permease [Pseudomonas citronellolis]|uniref:ABC transporter permease n=1 Tax=Pseudomonas citronellolis TaxID=53408 RepID=UPI0008531918|nr:ABC transporter permease subunit [Pseudomonas humi]
MTSRRWALLGGALLLVGWQLLALRLGPLLMATPWQTLQAMVRLPFEADFRLNAGASLLRIVLGVGLGCLLGFCLGLLAGLDARVRGLLEPLSWLLMSVPPVVVVVLAMLWVGLGSAMVVLISVLMLAPGMYVNTVKGMQMVDRGLLEMARVYRFSPWQKLRRLYIPSLTAALLIATCGGVRLVVMAEVLGAESGAGFALANARSTFDSAGLYAWTLLILLLVAALEFLLLQPLQRRMGRWQEAAHA